MPASPFEIITPQKTSGGNKKGVVVAVIVILFLVISVVIGLILVRQNQNIEEKAAKTTSVCPGAEACPYALDKTLLRSCHPADGTSPTESVCNVAGRVETCGPTSTKYCCPSVGAAWTTDMTKCQTKTPTPTPLITMSPTPQPTNAPVVNLQSSGNTYTSAQIATHNTSSNCWLIISNKVYNVSTYLVQHPGGVNIVTPYCGKEATQAFNTRGGNGTHSNTAKNLLAQYLVGDLVVNLPTATPTQAPIISSNIACNGSCTNSSQCASGRVCYITSGNTGFCRTSVCVSQASCLCPTTVATATATATATVLPTKSPTPTAVSQITSTATSSPTSDPVEIAQVQTSPRPIPETGTSLPTIIGIAFGVLAIIGSFILAF